MSTVPVHLVVLDKLAQLALARLEDHRIKAGNGLKNDEYWAMVGRIREGQALLGDITALQKQLRNDDDIEEATEHEVPRKRRSR